MFILEQQFPAIIYKQEGYKESEGDQVKISFELYSETRKYIANCNLCQCANTDYFSII